ncbi:MAG: ABC transporter permease, partial [Thermoanaerobaculia bacterium]
MLSEIISLCFKSFKTHKTRSILSALGVFFGVGAVIGMLSIGEGAKKEVLNLIKMMGEKHIILKVSKDFTENQENRDKAFYGLGFSDLRILKEGLPGIKALSPSKKIENLEFYSKSGEKAKGNLFAVQKDYKELINLPVKIGRFFDEEDEREGLNVCVIGKGLSLKLFGSENPLGKKIKALEQWYTVVGVVYDVKLKKGQLEGIEAEEYDKSVYVPLRSFILKEGIKEGESTFDEIAISLKDLRGLKEKKIYLEKLFKRLH